MSITASITVPLLGQVHTLTITDVGNWQDVMDHIGVNNCDFKIIYDGVTYQGVITKTVDESNLLMVFNDVIITLPSGMCMIIDCLDNEPDEDPHTHCFNNLVTIPDGTRKFMVVDDDGCPIGFVLMQQILEYVLDNIDIPTSLCELLGVNELPQGNLVAEDRILTTVPGGCTLKSVPQTDLDCD